MITQYVYTLEHAESLMKKAQNRTHGKPLGSNKYYRLHDDPKGYSVHYGRVGAEDSKIYTINKDESITWEIQVNKDFKANIDVNFGVFNQVRMLQAAWIWVHPSFSKALSYPGWHHLREHPIFPGFTMLKNEIITPRVEAIEDEIQNTIKEMSKRNKEYTKIMKTYAKFGAFNDCLYEKYPTDESWRERQNKIHAFSYESIDPEDIESFRNILNFRKSFGCHSTSNLGVTWSYKTQEHDIDFDRAIPHCLRQLTLISAAIARDDAYQMHYNGILIPKD